MNPLDRIPPTDLDAAGKRAVMAMFLCDIGYRYYERKRIEILDGTPLTGGTGHGVLEPYRRYVFQYGDIVYKLWGKDYHGGPMMIEGIKRDFYREVAEPLLGLVFDDEANCCGYVMRKCRVGNLHKTIVGNLVSRLIEVTKRTGLYFRDCIPRNMCSDKNVGYILDLESLSDVYTEKGYTKNSKYSKAVLDLKKSA